MSLTAKRKRIQLILTPMRNAIELAVTEDLLEANPFESIKLSGCARRNTAPCSRTRYSGNGTMMSSQI
jgi:hypothetical protein